MLMNLIRFRYVLFLMVVMSLWSVPTALANFSSFESVPYSGPHKVWAIDTEHFTVEYSPELAAGPDSDNDGIPNLVESVAGYAEVSWQKQVDDLGFVDPLENYTSSGYGSQQERIYLILDDFAFYVKDGSVGLTSVMLDGSLYMAIDPSISTRLQQVTVAHEFTHVIQFSYQGDFIGYDQDLNFAEQTAVAMEDYVYDGVNDYWNYLHHFFEYPDYSILTGIVPEDSLFEYGLGVWPRFLVEYLEGWEVLPLVTQAYFNEAVPDVWDSFEAYFYVIEETYGLNFEQVYQDFSLWNYLVSYYEEGANYPAVRIHATHGASEYPLVDVAPAADFSPALFGANYLQFFVNPSMQGQDFKFTLTKPLDVDFGVIVLPETDQSYLAERGAATIYYEAFDTGVFTLPIGDDVTTFTVIVSPLYENPMELESSSEAFSVGYPYKYSVEIGDFLDGEEIELNSFLEGEQMEAESGKLGEQVSENSPESGQDLSNIDVLTVHELAVTSKDESSVTLRWSRLLGDEVNGYRVYYGYGSGDYLWQKDVSGAHITHTTVDVTVPFGDYFFAVKGLNSDGEESGVFSNEVSVSYGFDGRGSVEEDEGNDVVASSEAIEFSDVPVSDDHYDAISVLTELLLFEGYPDGTFKPARTINRAEFMKLLLKGDFDLMDDEEEASYGNCFPDVQDQWFAKYVCLAAESGWVKGYSDGLFHLERTVSRAEVLKIVYLSAGVEIPSFANTSDLPYKDVFGSAWYAPYVVQAYKDGLLENTTDSFGPNEGQNRAQVAEIIYRYFIVLWFEDEPFTQERENQFQEEWKALMGE